MRGADQQPGPEPVLGPVPGPEGGATANQTANQSPMRPRDVPAGRWAMLVLNICLLAACVTLTATSPLAPWRAVPSTPTSAPPLVATAGATTTAPDDAGAPLPPTLAPPTPTARSAGSGGGPAPTATPLPTSTPTPLGPPTATPTPIRPTPTVTPHD